MEKRKRDRQVKKKTRVVSPFFPVIVKNDLQIYEQGEREKSSNKTQTTAKADKKKKRRQQQQRVVSPYFQTWEAETERIGGDGVDWDSAGVKKQKVLSGKKRSVNGNVKEVADSAVERNVCPFFEKRNSQHVCMDQEYLPEVDSEFRSPECIKVIDCSSKKKRDRLGKKQATDNCGRCSDNGELLELLSTNTCKQKEYFLSDSKPKKKEKKKKKLMVVSPYFEKPMAESGDVTINPSEKRKSINILGKCNSSWVELEVESSSIKRKTGKEKHQRILWGNQQEISNKEVEESRRISHYFEELEDEGVTDSLLEQVEAVKAEAKKVLRLHYYYYSLSKFY